MLAALLCLVPLGKAPLRLPAGYDPFQPLDLTAEPNWLTRLKLARLEWDGAQCRAALRSSPLVQRALPDRVSAEGCALQDVVEVSRSGVAFSSRFTATCALAAAWALFEAHALQPAAQRHFGQRIARVSHLGTFACRNVYGREGGRRSEHASANAIDIAGFVLADGSDVVVRRDWSGRDARRAAFLREVHDGACRFFDTVLGPAYNQAHHDHLHLDMGPYRVCR